VIFHVALKSEWEEAKRTGTDYRRSTLGKSLEEVGFIHCSYEHQVPMILTFYEGREVVILEIDQEKVSAEIKEEGGFPHVYGPLPLGAVAAAAPG
jgi:glutathione S-transferase